MLYDTNQIGSNNVSFLSHKSSKIDRNIIEKLMSYIESTLEKKLNSIEQLIEKNKTSLKKVQNKALEAERKLMNYKRETAGSSLISDDIKFFFNLVKSKPKGKVIKGVLVKDGRPSPRFGTKDRFPEKRVRSKSIGGNRKHWKREKSDVKDVSFDHKNTTFVKSRTRTPMNKHSNRNISRQKIKTPKEKKDLVPLDKRKSSISRGDSRPKSPIKRWERLYNMANEKAEKAKKKKIEAEEEENNENDQRLINIDKNKVKLRKSIESTKKKQRQIPAILDNQHSPSKKLKNQRHLRRSKRLLDSKEIKRKNQIDRRCFDKINKMKKEYQKSGISYCESSDSSCENLKTTEVHYNLYQESTDFQFNSQHKNNILQMASTESEKNQTKQYLDMMIRPPRNKKRSYETALNPTNDTTFDNSGDFTNLDNYTTDRPNHISPIRQKREKHPLEAFGDYEVEIDLDSDISNTERLIHQTVGNLNDESFSKDRMGKRLIDGMLEVDCNDSRVLNESHRKRRPDDTWKEIEAERLQVVRMLEGMMKSNVARGDYSSAENIFKHYESFKQDEVENKNTVKF